VWLVDLLIPRRCVSCGASVSDSVVSGSLLSGSLCRSCRSKLRVLSAPRCARCGAPTVWAVDRCLECAGRRLAFASARAAVAYAGPARSLVHGWKERGLRRLAGLAAELVVAHVERPAADVIAYIPPDRVRQLQRGHHPAERLARELGEHWSLEVRELLARTRPGVRQTGLDRAERRANVRGAFVAVPGRSVEPPPTVLLVDDVYTTGATVGAAAAALRSAGVARIHVVTFARTVR
jgi:ComF family protein